MNTDVKPIALTGATAITPYRRHEDCTLVLEKGKIAQMGHAEDVDIPFDAEVIELDGQYVLPGFIDIHIHGGRGHDFCDEDLRAFDEISEFHASHGTTSLIATVYPQPRDALLASIRRLREYCEMAGPRRIVEGIHLEGPFLNPLLHGAIRADYMWPATIENFRLLMEEGGSWVRVMTIAPEIPGGMEVLHEAAIYQRSPELEGDGWPQRLYLSVGHSNAKYEQLMEAIDNGLEGVTHIFNAMPPMHHRKPGVLTGTMLRDELFVEVIADSVHVHPAILQLLMKIKKHDRILLISDAIRAAGQPDGSYVFSDQEVQVRNGRAYLADSPDTLAGSTLTMDRAVKTMVQHAGATLQQAAQMASLNAARVLAWKYRRGILAVGKDADLAILDENFQTRMTIKAGHVIWSAHPVYH